MQDDGTVAVLGSLNMDIVIRTEHLPRRGETLAALDVSQHPGGKGANQAAAAAKAGAQVRMMGAVGEDAFGASLLDTLARLGVDTSGVARLADGQTGTAYGLSTVADALRRQGRSLIWPSWPTSGAKRLAPAPARLLRRI